MQLQRKIITDKKICADESYKIYILDLSTDVDNDRDSEVHIYKMYMREQQTQPLT